MTGIYASLCAFSALLVSSGIVDAQSSGMPHGEMKQGQMRTSKAHNEVCRGFLVLKNGYAVMSGMLDRGGGSDGHHGHGDMTMDRKGGPAAAMHHSGSAMQGMKHETGMADHLMGLRHGGDHPVSAGVLCVPIDESTDSWHAMSEAKDLQVTVRSLKGALQHNSRENEGLEVMLMRGGNPIENADVLLIARMPHHDRSIKGGHGLANDPDVRGIEAIPSGKGRYTVRTADFSMHGSWLFEIDVKEGDEVAKAYFATPVGEE